MIKLPVFKEKNILIYITIMSAGVVLPLRTSQLYLEQT